MGLSLRACKHFLQHSSSQQFSAMSGNKGLFHRPLGVVSLNEGAKILLQRDATAIYFATPNFQG